MANCQSSDLTPIENLWRYLKIQTKIYKSIIENYNKRLIAVEVNKGYSKKY